MTAQKLCRTCAHFHAEDNEKPRRGAPGECDITYDHANSRDEACEKYDEGWICEECDYRCCTGEDCDSCGKEAPK